MARARQSRLTALPGWINLIDLNATFCGWILAPSAVMKLWTIRFPAPKGENNDRQSCHQRIWPHRPQHPARHP
ncbi:hypothetical protein MPL3356_40469 [Mesorhizobium plurifarium]|uniref:Uncharacterized protein n=1 Tax=Mesorhizobium plurifarium TaxID=69974 RepID=A0A090E8N9_MESPL|nr:hypothetical protein MPL3356_40469 [Mesorhizobium plurifarium]